MDIFSSPLNPEMFAHPPVTSVLGPIAGASGSVPSSIGSYTRLQASFPSLDAHESPQDHSSSSSFASPSYPYQKPNFPDQANLASVPYGIKPKLRRLGMVDVSSSVPRSNGTNCNGLSDGKHHTHDRDVGTHSRQGSTGKLFVKKSPIFAFSFQDPSGSAVSSTYLPPSYTTSSGYSGNPNVTAGRSNAGLPPTLWMSPSSTSPSTPSIESYASFHAVTMSRDPSVVGNGLTPSSTEIHRTLCIPSDSPESPEANIRPDVSSVYSDILSDNLFTSRRGTDGASTFPSPVLSGSPDLHSTALSPTDAGQCDPEQLAKDDPLATQVWKMYTRTKANLPHAQRMENLTWRMMALALKKKKDDEANQGGQVGELEQAGVQVKKEPEEVIGNAIPPTPEEKEVGAEEERGRRIDKGKTKVSVVGFDGANQDNTEDDE